MYVEGAQISVENEICVYYDGKVVMLNENDYILANGDFSFSSGTNHSDYLTAGVLEVRGNFVQRYYDNFIASGTHTTILSPKKDDNGKDIIQVISFEYNPGTTRFNKVVLKKKDNVYQFTPALSEISNEVVYDFDDEDAPTAVEHIMQGEVTEQKVTISFSAAKDNEGVVGYEIYRDGKQIGKTNKLTYTDNNVDSGKQYTYTVFAYDEDGNKASSSPTLVITTLEDL